MGKQEITAMMSQPLTENLSLNSTCFVGDLPQTQPMTGWTFWRDYYYPEVIRESYPVYISERAKDKGKQAFELLKMLKDKRFINLEKVSDFVDLMDELIKIL